MFTRHSHSITQRSVYARQHLFLTGLVGILLATVAFYIYCIIMSVSNVVLREELLLSISESHSDIGELETTYLAKKNQFNERHADQLGLVYLDDPTYIEGVGDGRSLTLGGSLTNNN